MIEKIVQQYKNLEPQIMKRGASFEAWKVLKLISRKIWAAEKSQNFPTVQSLSNSVSTNVLTHSVFKIVSED